MNQEKIQQHVQLPNNMTEKLKPQDLLVYVTIKRFMDSETKTAFPSLVTISKLCGASVPTVKKHIKNLEEARYIKVEDSKGRNKLYRFLKWDAFEPFSYEFLDKEDISFTEKAYLLASQQYMFKENGVGKISYSNRELEPIINMSKSTISRCDNSLKDKGYLDIIKAKKQGSGIIINEKFFHLDEFGQAVVFELQKQREDIDKNTENIEKLQAEVDSLKKDLKIVLNENKKLKQEKEEREESEKLKTGIMT